MRNYQLLPELLLGAALLALPVNTAVAALAVSATTSGSTVGRYDIFEVTLKHSGVYANPWEDVTITAVFTAPSGRTYNVGGFYYDAGLWKLRFAPSETGPWTWRLTFAAAGQQFNTTGSFSSAASANSGFVRLNPANPRRFRTEGSNAVFYPLGFNDCVDDSTGPGGKPDGRLDWYMDASGPYSSDQYFSAYAAGKNNMFRHGPGNCSYYLMDGSKFNYQGSGKNYYFAAQGKLQDELASKLRQYGMKYLMVIFSDPTYYVPGYDLSNAQRKQAWLNYNKYVINRWGAYVDIWELMNEKSGVPGTYYDAMTAFIKGYDPYQHPITTSYQPSAPRAGLDATDVHTYFSQATASLDYAWVYDTYGIQANLARYPRQPLIFGESGNSGTIPNYDPVRYRISIWTPMLNQASVLFWNMSYKKEKVGSGGINNMYIGPEERNFSKILMNSMGDLPAVSVPIPVTASSNMRAYALGSATDVAAYLVHTTSQTTALSGAKLTLNIPASGMRGSWIDPATGNVIGAFLPAAGLRTLSAPPFKVDVALRLRAAGGTTTPPPTNVTGTPVPATTGGGPGTTPAPIDVSGSTARFLVQGASTELVSLANGSAVFPSASSAGLAGALVVKGKGTVTFGTAGAASGVAFGMGGSQNLDTAFYSFTGPAVKDLFSPAQNQVGFKLTSQRTFAERLALPSHNYRWVFDVYDSAQRLYYFYVLAENNQLAFQYNTGGSSSQYYVVPAAQADAVFGKGVTLDVRLTWDGTSSYLYLNGNLVRTLAYTALSADWTGSPSFSVGATDVHVYGGGAYSCDDLITGFQVGP